MTSQIRRRQGQQSEFPKRVTSGSATVTVYEVAAKTNANGKGYIVAWQTPNGRKTQSFADAAEALEEARIKAAQLAMGRIDGAAMTRGDRDELQAARTLTNGRPLLTALEEWAKAYELTGGRILDAANAWAAKHSDATRFHRVLASDCVEEFIESKNKAGKEGERTYGSKLKPIKTFFEDRSLDEISTADWTEYLEQWHDGVTRNDFRKRAVTMCLWARDVKKYLPRGIKTEIEFTERVKEAATEIGILTPTVFREVLAWTSVNHPEYLAALILAGFCGIRSDEIHGKRGDRDATAKNPERVVLRQKWEDILVTPKAHRVILACRAIVPVEESASATDRQ